MVSHIVYVMIKLNCKMKNIKKILLLSLFILLCISCNKKQLDINSFDVIEEVTAYDSIFSDKDEPFGRVTGMKFFNNMLILEHMNDDFEYSFIDVLKKQVVCRWGKTGEGPDEFIDFGADFFIQDSCMVFLTFAKKELNYVHIKDILNHTGSINVRKEKIPYNANFRPLKICPVGDVKIAVGSFEEGFLGVLDSKNEIMNTCFDYPFSYNEIQGIYKGIVFQSLIGSNNNQDKFVTSILSSDVFKIFEVSGSKINEVYTSSFKHVPQILEKGGRYTINYENSIAGLMKMATSDKYICFTYSTLSDTEAGRLGKASKEVLCFDWTGEKVKKYILPFEISSICLDNDYIYGVRYLDDETVIYRFKL